MATRLSVKQLVATNIEENIESESVALCEGTTGERRIVPQGPNNADKDFNFMVSSLLVDPSVEMSTTHYITLGYVKHKLSLLLTIRPWGILNICCIVLKRYKFYKGMWFSFTFYQPRDIKKSFFTDCI